MHIKKIIILGATSGIGKGLAQHFAAQGHLVGISGRRTEKLEALQRENPNNYRYNMIDITDTETLPAKLDALTQALGGLDLLLLSSGTGDLNDTLDFEKERQTLATNVQGFTCAADWAFNFFEKQQSGHLAAISSVAGLRGNRHAPAYNASKAYQQNYLEGLRQKAAKLEMPIYVTDIRPGFVDTDMAKGEGLFWVAPVSKATRQIARALERRKKVSYISRRWRLVAALLSRIPRALYDRM